jgi:hypothetical protein
MPSESGLQHVSLNYKLLSIERIEYNKPLTPGHRGRVEADKLRTV